MEHRPVSCFLVPFLLLCFSLGLPCFCAAGDEHFVFSGFAGANNLALDGTATVTPQGLLELTNNEENIEGHAFFRTPFQFKESPNGTMQSFSATFVFAIVSDYPGAISSDGMAFLVAPRTNFSDAASASQYLGFLNSTATNHTFAVELDTVDNLELGDIDNNHVGIHVASLYSLQSHAAAFYDDKDGMFKNLSLISGEAMQLWVDYDAKAKQIDVTLAPMGVAKPSKPLLSKISDLSTVITEQAFVGFSAATGPIKSWHCVLAWSFAMNGPAPAIDFNRMPKLPNSGHKTALSKILQIALPIAASTLILATCVAVILIVRRQLTYAELREDWEVEFGPHRFSYRDLFHATEGFKNKNILGVGGFGKVYKGVLPKSKLEVAVKRVAHDSNQGIKEFISEVVSIGHLRHRNLVQLLGYCRRKGELLLVYDYMPNGSLDKYLYGEEDKPILEWAQRFQIIKDVASGLFYLHEKWEQVVIHRDIKASNVLLDGGMVAHLGDFGLARLYDHGTSLQTTHVVGTMGYIAPELARTGKASPLTDVYAFGTFLLEVTCGRQPVINSVQHGRKMLVDRVLQYWRRGALAETVDSRLQGHYNADEACLVLTLGLMCSHPFPSERPTMRQVMQYLDGDTPLPELTPASMSLLSLMQNEGSFDQSVLQYPWSATSMSTMTAGISVGR
ncbi:L-type lectin-domain containing receptor kinase SIT2-like [Phragmites australis]|uniref:L-type lectin-domain containing receptor kinase SIT2-like n=1 Tax=Phragmites australis TaxID=29695 RepID=UPI002D77770F|nr:L-type lectin-domain containing receptor kinase SIT2-like [Phragmites australis]